MNEEAVTSGDQLIVVRQWLDYMDSVEKIESYTYGEVAEVQAVYDIIKDNIY